MKFEDLGKLSDASALAGNGKRRAKLTIQRSGRGGLSFEAGRLMGITDGAQLLIAVNGDDWFVKVVRNDVRAFKLRGAANYFSADLREFLRSINVDYTDRSNTTIYDIEQFGVDDADGNTIWKFSKRVQPSVRRAASSAVDVVNEDMKV